MSPLHVVARDAINAHRAAARAARRSVQEWARAEGLRVLVEINLDVGSGEMVVLLTPRKGTDAPAVAAQSVAALERVGARYPTTVDAPHQGLLYVHGRFAAEDAK